MTNGRRVLPVGRSHWLVQLFLRRAEYYAQRLPRGVHQRLLCTRMHRLICQRAVPPGNQNVSVPFPLAIHRCTLPAIRVTRVLHPDAMHSPRFTVYPIPDTPLPTASSPVQRRQVLARLRSRISRTVRNNMREPPVVPMKRVYTAVAV